MMRRNLALLLVTAILVTTTACAKRTTDEEPPDDQQPETPPVVEPIQPPPSSGGAPPEVKESPLKQAKGLIEFTPAAFAGALTSYLNEHEEDPAALLLSLYDRWQVYVEPQSSLLGEADLDDDGAPELVTALTGFEGGASALLVLYREDGQYKADTFPQTDGQSLFLHQILDLTGDGRKEVLYSRKSMGAHTAYSDMIAANWSPGRLTNLPGVMTISQMQWEIAGRDILLSGGVVGSAGAGLAQRPRTDRYRFVGGRFTLVDRTYGLARFGYHDLQDGIVAETYGRIADAETAFRRAIEPGRMAIREEMLIPVFADRFQDAVQAFARLRLGILLLDEGKRSEAQTILGGGTGAYKGLTDAARSATTRAAACEAAESWVRGNTEFLDVLNAVEGYANPNWYGGDLCGPLPAGN